jgi:uncharacterized protein
MLAEQYQAAIRLQLEEIPGIRFALLYGSAVDSITFRDVDIGLWIDPALISKNQEVDLCFDLAGQLEKLIPFPVDVRVINQAPLAFRYNVSKGIPLFIANEDEFTHFLERTWDDYIDFAPVAMQYLREMA